MSTPSDFYAPVTTINDYLIINSYSYNGTRVYGEFPVYITGVSQCCDEGNGVVLATPISVPSNE